MHLCVNVAATTCFSVVVMLVGVRGAGVAGVDVVAVVVGVAVAVVAVVAVEVGVEVAVVV